MSSYSLSGEYYTHQYEVEKTRLFSKLWFPVGITNEFHHMKNGYKSYLLPTGESIIITKDENNTFRAFFNTCRHRGNQLVDIEDMGSQFDDEKRITCAYHCWSYDLTGDLKSTPMCTSVNKKDHSLYKVDLQILNHILYVRVNQGVSSPLDFSVQHFSPVKFPMNDLDIVYTDKYTVNANWKFLIQNFCCWYHVPFIHPSLTKVSGMKEHDVVQFTNSFIHFKTDPITFDPSSPIDPKKIISMSQNHLRTNEAHFMVFFPNTFVFIFPDHAFQVFVNPISDTESVETVHLMVSKDMKSYNNYDTLVKRLIKFYVDTNNEDIGVCETLQKGVKSRVYKGGPYVLPYEAATQQFDTIYKSYMTNKSNM